MQDSAKAGSTQSSTLAYVLPFALFLLLTTLEGWGPLAEVYPVVYTAKVIIVAAAWWYFRKQYPAPSARGLGIGVVVGVLGIGVWVVLSRWVPSWSLPGIPADWLSGGTRMGFNPWEAIETPVGQWLFVLIRLAGLAVVVPLMEEVFWRGFLARWLISDDFERIPVGTYSHVSFAVVTIAFALAHPEFLAALIWGAAVNGLLYYTKNLWTCIVAHAVTNALLGAYVLASGAWELW